MYAKIFESKRRTTFVTSAISSSVNITGLPVPFMSANDPDLRKQVMNLVLVELLGFATLTYFHETRQQYAHISDLQNKVSTMKLFALGKSVMLTKQ